MQYPWPAGEVRISLSVEEAEAFHEAAAREGQSLEGWVRAQCLRAARDGIEADPSTRVSTEPR